MRILLLLLCSLPLLAFTQALPTIEEKTKDLEKQEGYFTFYKDKNNGKLWLQVPEDAPEFLYVTSLPGGLGSNDIGLDRGLIGAEKLVRFKRVGKKLLLVQPNLQYRANSGDAKEVNAVMQSFATSTLWGFTIEAETNGSLLVDATDFLVRDAMQAAQTIRNIKQGNYALDKTRSALNFSNTKNFPYNTEMEAFVTLVNSDGQVGGFVKSVAPSTEAITLAMHQSFVKLPDPGFTTRSFDPRAGYFAFSYYDYATAVTERLQKQFIPRHRLIKKDPAAAVSEPVEPIIYYLDPGTPEPIRSALLDGASWWNQAFEAAGFRNAFQVKLLPDGADPWDIRYNMINWVHRSTRGWSYGASIVDPRTGEIIKGQVTLGSLRVRQDYLIAEGLLAPYVNGSIPADNKMLHMALARMRQLAAHEVGHTLGLAHNYVASTHDRASVMDYPAPTVNLDSNGNINLTDAYATGIGDWDKVSISYGYAQFAPGTDEKKKLNEMLAGAYGKGLYFLSDADARPPFSLHPGTHLWDNGADAITELKNTMAVRTKALQGFGENNIRNGEPLALLEQALVPLYLYHRYQVEAVTKMVGGMDYTYAVRGDGQVITAPLPKAKQQQALDAVISTLDPSFLKIPERIAALIPPLRVGGELFSKRTGLAFDVLSPAEMAVDLPLSFLLNIQRMNRLSANAADAAQLSLADLLQTLISKTWKSPRRTGMEGLIQIQTEQILLTRLLAAAADDNSSFVTKAALNKALDDLKKFIAGAQKTASGTYAGHLLLALDRMKAPEKAKNLFTPEIPPGAPIGCEENY
ncbi:MAG: zinc-dependent metalloprotease [Flavisolibacter sp.]